MKQMIRVLIADDHALLRDSMRNVIDGQDDMEVLCEACDGEEAVRISSDMKPDIAVMDIVMPKMN